MSKLLMEDPPLMVQPSLACAIGLNEALVLQQVHYWLQRSTIEVGNHRWVYNTVDDWREQFPFWSMDTVRRTIASLKEKGLLISARLSANKFDRTSYYRIDREVLAAIEDGKLQSSNVASDPDHCNLPHSEGRNLPPSEDGSLQSSLDTEIPETTQENNPGDVPFAPPAKVDSEQTDLLGDRSEPQPIEKNQRTTKAEAFDALAELLALDVEQQVAADWLALRKKKRAYVGLTTIEGAQAEAGKAAMTLTEFLREWCLRGSQGLKAEWLQGKASSGTRPQGGASMTQNERIAAQNAETRRKLAERRGGAPMPQGSLRALHDPNVIEMGQF